VAEGGLVLIDERGGGGIGLGKLDPLQGEHASGLACGEFRVDGDLLGVERIGEDDLRRNRQGGEQGWQEI
jgi:hypothetical protein